MTPNFLEKLREIGINIICGLKNGTFFQFGEKYKCLHTWHGNTGVNYEKGGTILCKIVKENDSRATINANMKVSE